MLMQTHEARLSALREELKRRGLDGFFVPIADAHMSEYVGEDAQRLAWLTGFGGSAGSAAVLKDAAAMFTDGRYTVQVREQVDGNLFDYEDVPETSPAKWIAENAGEGAKIAPRVKVLGGDLHSRSNKTNGSRNAAGMLLVLPESWSRRPGSRPGFSGRQNGRNGQNGTANAGAPCPLNAAARGPAGQCKRLSF